MPLDYCIKFCRTKTLFPTDGDTLHQSNRRIISLCLTHNTIEIDSVCNLYDEYDMIEYSLSSIFRIFIITDCETGEETFTKQI